MATQNTPASIAALRIPRIEHNKTEFGNAITDLEGLKNLDYSPSFTSKDEAVKFHNNLNNIPYITVYKKEYSIVTVKNNGQTRYRIYNISYEISADEKAINPDLDAKRIKTMYMRLYEKNEDKYGGIFKFQLFEKFLRLVAKFRQMRGDAADQADQDEDDSGFGTDDTEYEVTLLNDFRSKLTDLIELYQQLSDREKSTVPLALQGYFKANEGIGSDLPVVGAASAGASKSDGGGSGGAASKYVDLRF